MDNIFGLIFSIFSWLWLLVVIGFVFVSFPFVVDFLRFVAYMRKQHPESWRGLGGWKVLFVYSLKWPPRFYQYIWNKEYESIGDEDLNKLAERVGKRSKRFFTYINFAIALFLIFIVFWIGAMYIASLNFR